MPTIDDARLLETGEELVRTREVLQRTLRTAIVFLSLSGAGGCARNATFDADLDLDRSLVEVVTIGADLQTTGFRDVRGIAVDASENIWVAEWDALIHLFSSEGEHLRSWNRKGAGPGEFPNITALDLDLATSRIVIRSSQWIAVLDEDLDELARWPAPVGLPSFGGIKFDAGGSGVLFPISISQDSASAEGGMVQSWSTGAVIRLTMPDLPVDTVASLFGGWTLSYTRPDGTHWFASMPGAGRAIWEPIGTGLLLGDGHRGYRLFLTDESGDTLMAFQRNLEGERFVVPADAYGGSDADGEFALGFISSVVFDQSREELLVCRVARPRLAEPEGEGGPGGVHVDYFDMAAHYIGTMEWPACPRVASEEGVIYTLLRGAFGEPIVSGFRYSGPEVGSLSDRLGA